MLNGPCGLRDSIFRHFMSAVLIERRRATPRAPLPLLARGEGAPGERAASIDRVKPDNQNITARHGEFAP